MELWKITKMITMMKLVTTRKWEYVMDDDVNHRSISHYDDQDKERGCTNFFKHIGLVWEGGYWWLSLYVKDTYVNEKIRWDSEMILKAFFTSSRCSASTKSASKEVFTCRSLPLFSSAEWCSEIIWRTCQIVRLM